MADEAKKGFWSRLCGTKNSGCCNVKIEEVTEEKPEKLEREEVLKIIPYPQFQSSIVGFFAKIAEAVADQNGAPEPELEIGDTGVEQLRRN